MSEASSPVGPTTVCCLSTALTDSHLAAFAPALTEQHKLLTTTHRRTARRHNHLVLVSWPVCSEVRKEQSLHHTSPWSQSDRGECYPEEGEQTCEPSWEQREKKKKLSGSSVLLERCLWIKSIKYLCTIGHDHSLLTVTGSKNLIGKLFFSP